MVQASPPFMKGATLGNLVEDGILSPMLRRLPRRKLNTPLYVHQEQAIRKMVTGGRNVVVATGTGSGKTECFMIPICDYLLRQCEVGSLGPGVRALLLYPMNALANDQVTRLRELLEPFTRITFGRYTGETLEDKGPATDSYRSLFRRDPLPNELVSRKEMQDSPPNILITNYAMLEYLLLRPEDHAFFGGSFATSWRFLVLDEAHTYSGAKGIETAMLLRRVKDRVVAGVAGRLQCVATSATLGQGVSDAGQIMEFASRLFGEEFCYDREDPDRQDLVIARREEVGSGSVWGRPHPRLYPEWQKVVSEFDGAEAVAHFAEIGACCGVPPDLISQTIAKRGSCVDGFLFDILSGDGNIVDARRCLNDAPRDMLELSEELFGAGATRLDAGRNFAAMISLAVRAREDEGLTPLLPARYHLMLRALNGAYISFMPELRLHLDHCARVPYGRENQETAVAYEVGLCKNCGAAYVLGRQEETPDGPRLVPTSPNGRDGRWYAVKELSDPNEIFADEDEDDTVEPDDGTDAEWDLCPVCGAISPPATITPACGCGVRALRLLAGKSGAKRVSKCVICGALDNKSGVVRRVSGTDAAACSVAATALYKELNLSADRPTPTTVPVDTKVEYGEDGWPIRPSDTDLKGAGPAKLLAFSDSRQDAAYFAPYVQASYDRMRRRNIVANTAREILSDQDDTPVMMPDLWRRVEARLRSISSTSWQSEREAGEEARKWVIQEFMGRDRNGLERLGLLGFELSKPAQWRPMPYYSMTWGLEEDEVWSLYQIMLDSLRVGGAIVFPEGVDPTDPLFEPRNFEVSVRLSGRDASAHVISWSPSRPRPGNKRSDYLMRLAARIGLQGEHVEIVKKLLDNMWVKDLAPHDRRSPWEGYFKPIDDQRNGAGYRLVPAKWRILAHGTPHEPRWYTCDTCGRLTLHNVRGVCPQYRCPGSLHSIDISERIAANHYVQLYAARDFPWEMRSEEHTAQLKPEAAARFQTEFQTGRINLLSCSTTFELGVDLGDLEAVLMRNMPPSPANYVQRAGRAGRRKSTAAIAVTYAQNRPHDSFYYTRPEDMLRGSIKPPHFNINNERIVLRHIYAAALAAFWRDHGTYLDRVKDFFFNPEGSGVNRLRAYLEARPESLKRSLQRIVPDEIRERLGVESWAWVNKLLAPVDGPEADLPDSGDEPGPLALAQQEVVQDIDALERRYRKLADECKPVDHLARIMETIKGRYLINYLSSRNVLPRYGFPVDVVNLDLKLNQWADGSIELERDLRLAISEYAPDSKVVARGKVWTSRYIAKMPQRSWVQYYYHTCSQCGNYVTKLDVGDGDQSAHCGVCGTPVSCPKRFIVPEFGFLADPRRPDEPGEERPERTYSTRVFFSGISGDDARDELILPYGVVRVSTSRAGRLAVINEAGGPLFLTCYSCGHATVGDVRHSKSSHKDPYGRDCDGKLFKAALGHEFLTDIARLEFEPSWDARDCFWYSLLYGIIEGASMALGIERNEIDGCLQFGVNAGLTASLVLFDAIPGGVGHVQRLRSADALRETLVATLVRLGSCECGGPDGDASCYRCLRNYSNQFCHDRLNRGAVIRFLETLGVGV
jgi:hypothetical protein